MTRVGTLVFVCLGVFVCLCWPDIVPNQRQLFIIVSFFLYFFEFYSFFSPILWYPIVVVATILSHCYNSRTGSGETKVESHASSDTQPNQAALLLNTASIQPGSQSHQCAGGNTVHLATLVSAHCAQPATGDAGAR